MFPTRPRRGGRHLLRRPRRRGPAVVGTAAALWSACGPARAALHEIAPGETLSGIAARYGTTVAALARANRISDPDHIVAGDTLRVPATGRGPAPAPAEEVGALIERHAAAHGLDPALVKAVAYHESGWRQDVVSSAGAVGIMQVLPSTGDYVSRVLGAGPLDIHRAEDNVHAGVMYLAHLMRVMPGEREALAAYYSGPGNVGRRLRPYQRSYVAAVQALRARF